MKSLLEIKRHVDGHGFGSAIVDDHVAIGVVWTTNTLGGEVRKREIIERYKKGDSHAHIARKTGDAQSGKGSEGS